MTGDEAMRARTTAQPRQAPDLLPAECWDLLRGTSLGRVVFTMRAMPAIRPVSHLVDGRTIVIRSRLGSAITGRTSGGAVVWYEADDIDPVRHTGWSVIVTGTARLATDPGAVSQPLPAGARTLAYAAMDQVIAITPEMVTGICLAGRGR
jgi:Pyridoxamine 5'-phosphate oxidase